MSNKLPVNPENKKQHVTNYHLSDERIGELIERYTEYQEEIDEDGIRDSIATDSFSALKELQQYRQRTVWHNGRDVTLETMRLELDLAEEQLGEMKDELLELRQQVKKLKGEIDDWERFGYKK